MPLAYLLATVITGLGLLVGSLIHVSQPEQVVRNSAPCLLSSGYVGRITGTVDCKWEKKGLGIRDWRLESGNQKNSLVALGDKFALASGLMEITYNTGAKVILQGPVKYSVESERRVFGGWEVDGEAGEEWQWSEVSGSVNQQITLITIP